MKVFDHGVKSLVASTPERFDADVEAWVTSGGHRRIFRSAVEKMMPNRASTLDGGSSAGLRVLLAEDDPLQVAYFQALVKRCTHPLTLTVVGDGSQALIQIERQRPDVVITDLMMKPFDGYHLIKALATETAYQSIAVLVVSAKSPAEARHDGELPSWVTVYQKPLQAERMLGHLDALCGRIARGV
jgi:CheY-like chemotaxis protein